MKRKNGFTLVELLAVIVILAIIMIIAIPAVLNTMQTASLKTFEEFTLKSINETEKKILSDSLLDKDNSSRCEIYSIKNDLGLSNTGSFDGYVLVRKNNGKFEYVISLKNDRYMLLPYNYSNKTNYKGYLKELSESIETYNSSQDELLSSSNLCSYGCTSCKINDEVIESECDLNVGDVRNFDYTGDVQSFIPKCIGSYKVELWGAAGGSYEDHLGGLGAYTSGVIQFGSDVQLYLYVGGSTNNVAGGYNGGASGGNRVLNDINQYTGGGGATDIRLVNGQWYSFDSLKSRIMVAGGGGGSGKYQTYIDGGAAGGLVGYDGMNGTCDPTFMRYPTNGASQVTGSSFGKSNIYHEIYGSGGGSGYYGGDSGKVTNCNVASGAGGSSFISGHNGCNALDKNSTSSNIIHTNQSIHYSGYVFTNTVMIDGNGYNWTNVKGEYVGQQQPNGSLEKGHSGNGYARITYLG